MKKRILIIMLLAAFAVSAQQLAWQQQGDEPVPEQPGEDSPAGQVQPGTDDSETPVQADDEPTPATPAADGPEGGVAEGVEDSEEIDESFTPDEEISEDYPVPLPADI